MSATPTIWALIPIKGSGQGKSRLAGMLSAPERDVLVDTMLRHAHGARFGTRGYSNVCKIVAPEIEAVADGNP